MVQMSISYLYHHLKISDSIYLSCLFQMNQKMGSEIKANNYCSVKYQTSKKASDASYNVINIIYNLQMMCDNINIKTTLGI